MGGLGQASKLLLHRKLLTVDGPGLFLRILRMVYFPQGRKKYCYFLVDKIGIVYYI